MLYGGELYIYFIHCKSGFFCERDGSRCTIDAVGGNLSLFSSFFSFCGVRHLQRVLSSIDTPYRRYIMFVFSVAIILIWSWESGRRVGRRMVVILINTRIFFLAHRRWVLSILCYY